MLSILRKILGAFFILLGLVALVTPLTPGALIFIFIGMEMLGISFLLPPWLAKHWKMWKEKMRSGKKEIPRT